jgi:1,5-anhydro-D-fructose reductase (1,5-anhydro-D-mannitol-forming)
MADTVRWGILGCGNVTEVKSGPGFQKAEGSRLSAVMRRSASLAEDYARRHGVPRWYADADALIRDPEVDAVYVATPPGSHLELALRVAAAGKPAYVEKPMARNGAECVAMIRAFEAAGVPLFVAYYRRALPRFLKVKDLIACETLGKITGVSYRASSPGHRDLERKALPWRLIAEASGGGLVMDVGCHVLDVVDFLLGPLSDVSGDVANKASACEVEDTVALRFRTGGVIGTASWNFASSVTEDVLEIDGTEARIRLSVFGSEPAVLCRGGETQSIALPNPSPIQQPLIQTMVDQLRGRGSCPSTGRTAMRTNVVLDTALSSYYGGRDDAYWLRPETWPGRRDSGR